MLTLIPGILAAVVLLAAFVRWFEPRFAFFPTSGESVTPRDFGAAHEPLTIGTLDGQQLRGWSIAGENASRCGLRS